MGSAEPNVATSASFQKNDAEESIIYIYGVVQVEFDKKYAVNMEMQIQT